MSVFNVLTMIGGLALFLYGMNLMGDGLSKASGGKMEAILAKLTSNPFKAVLLGAGVTAVIQSSSATTVMVVGFVNSGIMKLHQAVGIIMGANIGTTVTSWLLSLSGIESDNFFIQLLKPSSFSPILSLIGIIFLMFTKSEKKKDAGSIMLGFAILMFGMETMSGAVEPLKDVPEFTSILTMFSNPFLGMIAGALLTAVIQSSSASVGILQALCATGSLGYGSVLPIIMGQNIGTCVTALLSSIGANKNAKRAAFVHLYFNVIGTLVFMTVFYSIHVTVHHFAFLQHMATPAGIATIHSLFNVGATICLLPFSKVLEFLATVSVRDKNEDAPVEQDTVEKGLSILDERFLDQPGFALAEAKEATEQMAQLTVLSFQKAVSLLWNYEVNIEKEVEELENRIDSYEDQIGTYLMKIASRHLTKKDSQMLSQLQHCVGDYERISDHALNMVMAIRKMQRKEQAFSPKALEEFRVFVDAVSEILNRTTLAFSEDDQNLAHTVEPLEEVIDELNKEIKKRHVKRLRKGKCSVDMGFVLSDLSTDLERISDHCSNIAIGVLKEVDEEMEAHEYMELLKNGENTEFSMYFSLFKEQYVLP